MKQEHWNIIIDYFKAVVKCEPKPSMNNIQVVNNYAAKLGYVVHPDACGVIVKRWLSTVKYNPNSTFYRRWKDITDRSRMQLFLDQLIHYASTYGTGYEAETYCPNGDPIQVDYKQYRVIEAITDEQLEQKIMAVLSSGIALKSSIVEAFCEFLLLNPQAINIDAVKNREALVYLCSHLKIFPNDPETIVRYIFYITTGSPMLIQSMEMLRRVRCYADGVDLSLLTDEQVKRLAEVFNRFKRIFMALKNNATNVNVVNKISRLSKKYHKPFRIGFWENLTNMQHVNNATLDRKIAELTNPFKVVKLLEMIKLRSIQATNQYDRMFIIRNGKVWVDKDARVSYPTDFFNIVAAKLLIRLISLMKDARGDKKTIKLPNCELMCPSSEKTFVGNLPMGSYYTLADHDNYFGIYWRNEWGTRDFDLSFIHDGNKMGWNARYQDGNAVFSGDMTNADPEATEMLYIKNEAPNGTIYVNRYNGDTGSTFKLFFGQDKCDGFCRNYMVNPDSIILEDMMISDTREQMVGQVYDGKIYFLNLGCSDNRVSIEKNTDFVNSQCLAHIALRPMLEAAGYEIVTEKPDIDLSIPSKENILKLFIKEQ